MTDPAILSALAKMQAAVKYNAGNHSYKVNGERFQNVTSITATLANRNLIGWAGNLAIDSAWSAISQRGLAPLDEQLRLIESARGVWNRASDEAKDIGTEVHSLIEHEVRRMLGKSSEAPSVSDEARHVFAGWSDWAAEVHFIPLAVEFPVFSPAHKYAGRADILASILGGAVSVLDSKTTTQKHLGTLWPDAELQNLMYRAALREHGIIADGWIVQIPKDGGGPRAIHVPWSDSGFEAALGLQKAHAWLRRRER